MNRLFFPRALRAVLLFCATGCSSAPAAQPAQPAPDAGATDDATSAADAGDPSGPWSFTPVTVDGLPALWAAAVAEESPTVAYVVGGVSGQQGPVSTKVYRVEQTASGPSVTTVTSQLTPRFCACAMVDANRRKLIAIGGKDAMYNGQPTADIVDLATGAVAPLDAGDAAKHPVGCHAVFLPDRDEGYVFGGFDDAAMQFTGGTWRYTPADGKFTALTAAGPDGRYDGTMRYPIAGGPVWLVGGMGANGVASRFFADVWQLDPKALAWRQAPTQGTAPKGRRYAWIAFTSDASQMVYGFGTDTATGTRMLGDLWRLDVASGAWTELPRGPVEQPAARGFAAWLPGPPGSAGLLAGGMEDKAPATQALVVEPPVAGSYR